MTLDLDDQSLLFSLRFSARSLLQRQYIPSVAQASTMTCAPKAVRSAKKPG
jgi:hypothetical protein